MSRELFPRPDAKAELRKAFIWYQARRVGLGFEFLRTVRVMLATIERAPGLFPFAVDDIQKASASPVPLRRVLRPIAGGDLDPCRDSRPKAPAALAIPPLTPDWRCS